MQHRDLMGLDLNLLVVLDAVLHEGSVTEAARRLGRSQSAVSHAIGRLREQLDDPLFVRVGQGVEPTSRARTLQGPLRRLLEDVEALVLREPEFEPATDRRRFVLCASDYVQNVLMPPLVRRLRAEAPGLDIELTRMDADLDARVSGGEIDLLLPVVLASDSPLRYRRLWDDRFVCLVRDEGPGAALDLEAYVRRPHVLVAPRGEPGGVVDRALARVGRERRVALLAPYFLGTPAVVAQSDLIITLPRRLAETLATWPGVRCVEAPIELPGFSVGLAWHERCHHDPAHRWLREAIGEVVGEMGG